MSVHPPARTASRTTPRTASRTTSRTTPREPRHVTRRPLVYLLAFSRSRGDSKRISTDSRRLVGWTACYKPRRHRAQHPSQHRAQHPHPTRGRRPLVVLALLAGLLAALSATPEAPATADDRAAAARSVLPIEPLAPYEPQRVCSPWSKPGTLAMLRWTVRTYGGRSGGIGRACHVGAKSEHKEGRAFDWMLDARRARDRQRASRFLTALVRRDATGEPAALARRMGVMYVIWADRIYSAWDGFTPRPYLNSGCPTLRRCSRTLRHLDHVHVSLSLAGARALTSWYVAHPGYLVRGRQVSQDRVPVADQ